jgi:hypothetical protein
MKKLILLFGASLLAGACGGGGGAAPAEDPMGIVSIAITDAAVDDVKEVVVEFHSITLKPAGGADIVVNFDPVKTIDLFDLQDGETAVLLADTSVPVGAYVWMRLGVNAEFDNVMDSFVRKNDDSQVELRVPSGSQSGLKLQSGFTVTQDSSTNMVIDWDLRKALTDPAGQPGMHLRPALRVTDMASYGTLQGTVNEALTMADECGDDFMAGNVVYVYSGDVAEPLDIRNSETDPLVTAMVGDDLMYKASYLPIGEYTAAFTCQADLDDPELDDELAFAAVANMIMIANGETTTIDFGPAAP